MNIIAKLKSVAQVPTPPAGYAAAFLDVADNTPKIKLADGTVVNLRGLQGDKGDTGEITSVTLQMIPPNETPSVENTGTSTEADLLFKLPQSTAVRKSFAVNFDNGDTVQRVTVADTSVSPNAPPVGLTAFSPSTEGTDFEISYSVVLSSVGTGTFDVTVQAFDAEGVDLLAHPLPTITLSYITGV
jgi:hypothetical protein